MGGEKAKPSLIRSKGVLLPRSAAPHRSVFDGQIPPKIAKYNMNTMLGLDHLDDGTLDAPAPLPPAATYFAPAGRDAPSEIRRKTTLIERVPLLSKALDAMPGMVMILNGNRQIVVANRKVVDILGVSVAELVEKRPGEAINCIRANVGPDGCGTGVHCSTCGAVNAVLDCGKHNTEAVRECRILVQTPSEVVPLDLRVTASPFDVEGECFILVAIEDISYEKRVAVLQRTFFHDVLNTAGCIRGYADYLAVDTVSDPEVCQRLTALSGQLIEEIQSQRDLLHAESGDLQTQVVPVKVSQILEELRVQYLKHPVAAKRNIVIGHICEGPILADRRLLQRVLGNMLKNALEATPPSSTVTLACRETDDATTFMVNNQDVMPTEVQLQVFQRSFSTKGESGRGIGTYSMKLLGERYLGGKVDFVSRFPEGTTFCLKLPKKTQKAV
jgi:nitrogen-specific signal transduction histidine kinase